MRRILVRSVAACLLLAFSAFALGKDPEQPAGDARRLGGIWKAVALESNGAPRPADAYSGTTITFENERATLSERGQAPVTFDCRLGPDQSPTAIDFVIPEGPNKGSTLKGIYEFRGDELKICFRIGGERPAKFATLRGDNTELFTLERLPAEQPWEKFTAKEDGYTVDMPGKPEARKRRDNSAGYPVEATIYVVRSDRERLSFLAMGYKLPLPLADEQALIQALNAAKDKLLTEMRAKIVRERNLDSKNGQAREYLLRSDLGADVLVRIHIRNDRVYMLQVVGPEAVAASKSAERFVSSFQLTE